MRVFKFIHVNVRVPQLHDYNVIIAWGKGHLQLLDHQSQVNNKLLHVSTVNPQQYIRVRAGRHDA